MKNILIVEDEKAIADLIAFALKREGFNVIVSNDGTSSLRLIDENKIDLMLLDIMLPDISGLDICRIVTKKFNIPIIIITAKSDITDKILGLEFGADDYIVKPFDIREIIARVNVLFRRLETSLKAYKNDKDFVNIGFNININLKQHIVRKNGKEIELTPKEYNLLVYIVENKGNVLSREQLLNKIWGYEYIGDTRTVDIHIQRIRRKLDCPKIIETVFGFGYKLRM